MHPINSRHIPTKAGLGERKGNGFEAKDRLQCMGLRPTSPSQDRIKGMTMPCRQDGSAMDGWRTVGWQPSSKFAIDRGRG